METNYLSQRKQVAKWMRRLYKKGLTTSLGGNMSLICPDGHLLITPSATDKGRIKGEEIALLAPSGVNLTPTLKMSMETGMHQSIYKVRNDVKAIVHAHSFYASTFAALASPVNTRLLAEAYTILGEPAYADYDLPGSDSLASLVAAAAKESNVVIMKNHGVLAVGENLLQAFDRIEVLENAAKMTLLTKLLSQKQELTNPQLDELKLHFM